MSFNLYLSVGTSKLIIYREETRKTYILGPPYYGLNFLVPLNARKTSPKAQDDCVRNTPSTLRSVVVTF